jgi:Ca2+/H+ antiporter, TMEM165/GDT1 family
VDLITALTALALIVPAELPDKTFVVTLVLATRFRPGPVWLGVGAAFAVQTVIAVTLGELLSRLPRVPVAAAAALLFAVAAIVLWHSARRTTAHGQQADDPDEPPGDTHPGTGAGAVRAAATSFGVLFLTEWGDLSQLLVATLAARTGDPIGTFAGAWTGLLLVSGLAALTGRSLLRRLRRDLLHRICAVVCAVLAIATATTIA